LAGKQGKSRSAKSQGKSGGSIAARVIVGLVLVAAAVFAVQGGEWGTSDLVRQRARLARVNHEVDSLRHEVDSLRKYRTALETDPALQERIAREEFGMVRGNKELLYRFTEPAPAATKPK
jgi:cell division protein FtsB